jgi:hypothetical protein
MKAGTVYEGQVTLYQVFVDFGNGNEVEYYATSTDAHRACVAHGGGDGPHPKEAMKFSDGTYLIEARAVNVSPTPSLAGISK